MTTSVSDFVYVVRHPEPVTEEGVMEFLRAHGPAEKRRGVVTDEDRRRWAELACRDNKGNALWLEFPRETKLLHGQEAPWQSVYYYFVQGFRIHHEGAALSYAPFDREPQSWIWATSGAYYQNDAEAADWFLQRASPLVSSFQGEFAFADTQRRWLANADHDPRELAWPLMVLGPRLVDTLGRGRVEASPVDVVRGLPGGAVELRVARNPFDANPRDVEALAQHLGLHARRRSGRT